MSYEVLARKWRPQTFDEVVGQEHITRTLKKAVESSRLSHAYLFAGPRGCGKTSTARILAKVINCTNLASGNPCNTCPSCVGVNQGKNLDVMEIDGASHTGVGEVRDLQESIGYAPSQHASKVYIIDEVHMLSTHAFNALLKTLEEPPSHVYFVFATTAPHKIPDTIKSRCQRHHFKRLEIAEIAGHLETICDAEKVEWESDALRLLARKAEGSMRDGESLLDQCITASTGKVQAATVRDILGLLDHDMVLGFLKAVAGGDATAVLTQLDEAVHKGVDLEELLNTLIEGYRDLMLLAAPGDLSDLVFRAKDEIEVFKEVLSGYELPDLVTIVERMCNTVPRLKLASDPRILLESVLVDLTLLDRQTQIRDVLSSLERSGGAGPRRDSGARRRTPTATRPKPGPKRTEDNPRGSAQVIDKNESFAKPIDASSDASDVPESKQDARPSDVDLASLEYDDLRKLWKGFVIYIRQKKPSLGISLLSGTLQSFGEKAVTLSFSKGLRFQKDIVESASNKKYLFGMAKKYFGREFDIFCFVEGDEAEARKVLRESKVKEVEDSAPKRAIETRPIVKKILTDFDGEIVQYHPQ
jgi:DNA polymerase-3 subunit gamma/tau